MDSSLWLVDDVDAKFDVSSCCADDGVAMCWLDVVGVDGGNLVKGCACLGEGGGVIVVEGGD